MPVGLKKILKEATIFSTISRTKSFRPSDSAMIRAKLTEVAEAQGPKWPKFSAAGPRNRIGQTPSEGLRA
jgi:hypothetical protein